MTLRAKVWYTLFLWTLYSFRVQTLQVPISSESPANSYHDLSAELFADLEELSRLVDIAYCVGSTGTGIRKPFQCLSRCHEFDDFELVTTWNTGLFFSDSCGYIAISHRPSTPRIVVAFRGTYSITNTIIDLTTVPQEYIPYPGEDDGGGSQGLGPESARCPGCTVHAGFMGSWRQTRQYVTPHLERLVERYPDYQLTLVGHSLGGAVAALASLDFHSRGWKLEVTTFGEPRVGNLALMQYFDKAFIEGDHTKTSRPYRRVTHTGDPVPLLPISEWGYTMHGGEIYIAKSDIPPSLPDLRACVGDEDPQCIAGTEALAIEISSVKDVQDLNLENFQEWRSSSKGSLTIPLRFKIWQLFFAHRDYFWRLGLCIPGGDPKNWYRKYPENSEGEQ